MRSVSSFRPVFCSLLRDGRVFSKCLITAACIFRTYVDVVGRSANRVSRRGALKENIRKDPGDVAPHINSLAYLSFKIDSGCYGHPWPRPSNERAVLFRDCNFELLGLSFPLETPCEQQVILDACRER